MERILRRNKTSVWEIHRVQAHVRGFFLGVLYTVALSGACSLLHNFFGILIAFAARVCSKTALDGIHTVVMNERFALATATRDLHLHHRDHVRRELRLLYCTTAYK